MVMFFKNMINNPDTFMKSGLSFDSVINTKRRKKFI